jgi:hypothetical protein
MIFSPCAHRSTASDESARRRRAPDDWTARVVVTSNWNIHLGVENGHFLKNSKIQSVFVVKFNFWNLKKKYETVWFIWFINRFLSGFLFKIQNLNKNDKPLYIFDLSLNFLVYHLIFCF